MNLYVRCYIDTDDVKPENAPIDLPNYSKAFYWLNQAAQGRDINAQDDLSSLYQHGMGVSQNTVLAYVWRSIGLASLFNYFSAANISFKEKDYSGTQDKLYSSLSSEKKQEAQKIIEQYNKIYVIQRNSFYIDCPNKKCLNKRDSRNIADMFETWDKEPSFFDVNCQFTQSFIERVSLQKLITIGETKLKKIFPK
jgi:hypothetical protein